MKAHAEAARFLLAGTSRVPVPPQATLAASAPPALAPLLLQLGAQASDEARLWQTLAALDWTRRAGYQAAPTAGAIALPAATADELAPCTERAEALLRQFLGGLHPQLVGEWLQLAARHGRRIPHGLLPALLDLGVKQADLRPAIAAVADQRGRWLASYNPKWQYVAGAALAGYDPAQLQQAWDTGNPEERYAALIRWRQLAPDAARAALEASWKTEPPESRARLLRQLATGLTQADEALLESALDDKRKEVRIAAQELLTLLPGSALVGRMRERLAALVSVESRLLLGKRLKVELPAEATKPMLRDGIGRDKRRMGEKAGWLADMVAAMPLGHWSSLLDAAAPKALELMMGGERRAALLTGLSEACLRAPQAQPDWTLALLALWLKMDKDLKGHFPADFPAAVLGLGAATCDAALQDWVRASDARWTDDEPVAVLLARTAQPGQEWSRALSLLVMERTRSSRKVLMQPYSLLRSHAQNFAAALDATAYEQSADGWPAPAADDTPAWTRFQDDFLALARQRHELHLSFTGEPHGQ